MKRLQSIDALRGAVMIIMALDHTREFFHSGAVRFAPEDLSHTTVILFFTRWITHFCAPVFMFTAGMGASLMGLRRTKGQLSRFLLTRGLWLVFLELTVMNLAYQGVISMHASFVLLVLWALGLSMIVLAALIHLPTRVLAVVSVAVIALHNCLDGISFYSFAWLWTLLHQPGMFSMAGGHIVLVGYPLVPWFAVMSAGYCFGQVFQVDPATREGILWRAGWAVSIAFVLIRAMNIYGDPSSWSVQRSVVFTLLSFLRCTKYPPSLDFLLMTLGPALLLLAYLDRREFSATNPLIVFGRVPMFYFILHFLGLRALAALTNQSHQGYDLWVTYAVWAFLVAALYPLCRWYARIKESNNAWWLSYL